MKFPLSHLFSMAPQDYISRPRTNAKKSNPYKKKSANQQPDNDHKKKAAAVTLIFLLAAVGYGLWLLKNSDTTKNPTATISAEIPSKKKAQLPAPPKSKWTYINGLKTKEVEVGKYEVADNGPFKMQCGSFRTLAQANSLKAKIAFVGLEAMVKKATGSKGVWFKVYLGPYAKKRLAEKDKHQLKNNKINHCAIWLWK